MAEEPRVTGEADGPSLFAQYVAIRKADGLSSAEKMLLWAIHSRARNGEGVCTASARTLAADLGDAGPNADRGPRRWLKSLVNAGWVVNLKPPHHPRPELAMGPRFREAAAQEQAMTSQRRAERDGVTRNAPVTLPGNAPVTHEEADGAELGQIRPSQASIKSDNTVRQVKQILPSSRTSLDGKSDNPVRQTTPRTTPVTAPGMCAHLSLGEREGERGRGAQTGTAPLTEREKREAFGVDVVDFVQAYTPPSDLWWTWDPEKAMAVHVAEQLFGAGADKIELVERLARGGVAFADVAAACVVVGRRDRREIGNLERYLGRVARGLAAEEQDVSETDARWLGERWTYLAKHREQETAAWDAKMFRPTLRAHMPGALRAYERLEAIDAQRGVTEASEGAMAPMFREQFVGFSRLLERCGGWDEYNAAIERAMAEDPDADFLAIFRAMPGWVRLAQGDDAGAA
jgi:hypothetical protein